MRPTSNIKLPSNSTRSSGRAQRLLPELNLRTFLELAIIAAIYFGAARFGLSLASVHQNVSPVWPPTGVAIVAVLIFGVRTWPAVLIGAFAANALTPVPLWVSAAIAVGNTLEAASAGFLLRSLDFRKSFERAKDVFNFVVAALLCTMLSATIGNMALCIAHSAPWSEFGSLWSTWWLGDTVGALVLAPLLLTWAVRPRDWLPSNRQVEAVVVFLLMTLAAFATFGRSSVLSIHYFPFVRLTVPLFLWAAFRLRQRGVTLSSIVLSVFAVWGTANSLGPFVTDTPNESLLLLQIYLGSNAVTFLFLGALVQERRRSNLILKENERRLETNLAITRILAESPALTDATPLFLQTIASTLGWELGCLWVLNEKENLLRPMNVWSDPYLKAKEFVELCESRTFGKGVGLPGRVWQDPKPAWIPDVTMDANFPRAPQAIAEGLHAAFAFPILLNEEFLGVMEFFSHEIREPDEPLLAMFSGIGSQIGQFIERKRAEAEVESASLLPKENPYPVMRVDRNGVVVFANPAAETILADWKLETGQSAPRSITDTTQRALSNRSRLTSELQRGDQTYLMSFAPIAHADYVNIYFNEITERKRAEETLRRNEKELSEFFENATEAIHWVGPDGTILRANRAELNMLGYSAEEYVGKNIADFHADKDAISDILHCLKSGETLQGCLARVLHKDGSIRDVQINSSGYFENGEFIHTRCFTRDITEQKRAQEEISRLLALERTARQEAELANRAKDDFLAVLSHELRTPLTAILGWLTLLRTHKLDETTTTHAIDTIERNAKAQAQLIEDLVDVSRIVGGKLNLDVRPTDLLSVVNAAIEVIRPAAEAKFIELEVDDQSWEGFVSGDPARLQQVIANLLSNAVKFTPNGGSVSVILKSSTSDAEISVCDTGIGISANFLPHVFERFRQAESAATRSHRGLGLGLAIVRHLVELHGGSVTASSDGENRGATFTVRLPLATPAASHSSTRATKANNNGRLDGLRVLLVEDEPDARELIALALQQSGANVEAVDSVRDALASLNLFKPDVLLSDIGLPIESGYDLIRKVRTLDGDTRQLPAIALTAFATENDRQKSLAAGFHVHLAKPIEPSRLVEAINALLNGNSSIRSRP